MGCDRPQDAGAGLKAIGLRGSALGFRVPPWVHRDCEGVGCCGVSKD